MQLVESRASRFQYSSISLHSIEATRFKMDKTVGQRQVNPMMKTYTNLAVKLQLWEQGQVVLPNALLKLTQF